VLHVAQADEEEFFGEDGVFVREGLEAIDARLSRSRGTCPGRHDGVGLAGDELWCVVVGDVGLTEGGAEIEHGTRGDGGAVGDGWSSIENTGLS
jgi:hypothetical protein